MLILIIFICQKSHQFRVENKKTSLFIPKLNNNANNLVNSSTLRYLIGLSSKLIQGNECAVIMANIHLK